MEQPTKKHEIETEDDSKRKQIAERAKEAEATGVKPYVHNKGRSHIHPATVKPVAKAKSSSDNIKAEVKSNPDNSKSAEAKSTTAQNSQDNTKVADNIKAAANKEIPKAEEKKEKKPELKKVKKEEAVYRGSSLPISLKQSMAIGRFIRGKTIDGAIALLQDVIKFKRPVPYVGEIPHRNYPGVMSGRYPITASAQFITALKSLKGNCLVAGLELDKVRIFSTSPSWASRPQMRNGATFKRLNLVIIAREIKQSKSDNKENKEAKK